jgi:dTDP-4-amino-4,6-dideoxygalactose transaminase
MKIPISKPFFGDEEKRAVQEPLETGWVVQGPRIAEFERMFCAYTGAKHSLATTSCTTALQLAMVALGIGAGDEVIVPAFTWVATANVVEMQGAKPVFVDIELDTFNISVDKIEAAITPRTKAIIPVSLFGISADMKPIVAIARKHGLKVVEDDACATGAWYHGSHAGTLADIGCFSFHPRKAISTGEGGMVITNNEALAQHIQSLRDHGASKSDLARHLGARSYLPDGCRHGYQSYVCLFKPEAPSVANVSTLHAKRNSLMDNLEKAGIATRPGTHAVHMLDYYREKYGVKPADYPNAYLADQLSLAIPLYAQMTDEEQSYVIEHLKAASF